MQARAGGEWETARGTRMFEVTLDDGDGALLVGGDPERWARIPVRVRFALLANEAEQLTVTYMSQEGAMTTEYAEQRMTFFRAQRETIEAAVAKHE